jgi:hypothetical protein
MNPFFTGDHGFSTVSPALENLLPQDTTRPRVQARAIYQSYVNALAAQRSDDDLRSFRDKALRGDVTPPAFATRHPLLTTMKSQAPHAVTRRPRQHTGAAEAHLHSVAMLLAQILCVDNSLKEGWRGRIEAAARDGVLDGLSTFIQARSATNGAALAPDHARGHRGSCWDEPPDHRLRSPLAGARTWCTPPAMSCRRVATNPHEPRMHVLWPV